MPLIQGPSGWGKAAKTSWLRRFPTVRECRVTLAVSLESALKNSKQSGHPDAHWQQSVGESSLGTCQAFCWNWISLFLKKWRMSMHQNKGPASLYIFMYRLPWYRRKTSLKHHLYSRKLKTAAFCAEDNNVQRQDRGELYNNLRSQDHYG